MTFGGGHRERICAFDSLRRAFAQVRVNLGPAADDRYPQADDQSATIWLTKLADELREGTWRPGTLRQIDIPKPNGGTRSLRIPGLADRVVERSIVDDLTDTIDPILSPVSFAYRPGLGVGDAVRALASIRDEGYTMVVRTDIADCFDTLDHDRLLADVGAVFADSWLDDLIRQLLRRGARTRRGFHAPTAGVAQGAPLSPLLCNLYLNAFDRHIANAGVPMIRYADDITLACTDGNDALEVRQLAIRAANTIGLDLSFDKTRVSSFEDGFVFLGEDIGPVLPTSAPRLATNDPDHIRRSVYVTVEGSAITTRSGQLVVRHDDADLLTVPLSMIDRTVLVGAVGLSAGFRSHALNDDQEVTFLSRRGNWIGTLESGLPRNATRLRQQVRRADHEYDRLDIARTIVAGKLANLRPAAALQPPLRSARTGDRIRTDP